MKHIKIIEILLMLQQPVQEGYMNNVLHGVLNTHGLIKTVLNHFSRKYQQNEFIWIIFYILFP